jgi:hypothetical protein
MKWVDDLLEVVCKKRKKKKKKSVIFAWNVGMAVKKGGDKNMPLDVSSTNEQKIPIGVNPVTMTGNPASLDGPISVSIVSGEGTVEMIDDRNFFVVSGSNPGDTAYLVEGDADLGAGVETIQDMIVYHVEGAKATNLGMSAGAAVPK